jgi:uncharacterized membrane protein YkoI
MAYRYVLAAALLAATSLPAAAQQTTQPDTSKKASTSGTTTTTSNGAVAEPPAAAAPNPNGPSATPGASINSPASTTAPSSTSPSTGTVTTSPAPTSGAASTSPSGVTSTPSDASTSGASTSGASTSSAMGATGQVQPTSGAVKVDVKVAPTLANSVKISADSAFALARASGTAGEISSAELEMKEKALVYNIKMVKGAGASVVHVDAMTGQVVKDKKYGGLKASAENDKQLRKLEDAKEDSTKARKP